MRVRGTASGALVIALVGAACSGAVAVPDVPGDAAAGAVVYERHCAGCHGVGGIGVQGAGPSLLDERYGPSLLDDRAAVRAIVEGAPEEAWNLGPMPRTRGLSEQDLADLLAYLRSVQEAAGIR